MTTISEQAAQLLAVTGETTDAELIEATRVLRDVAAEYDEVGGRFEVAGAEVRRLLLERTR